MLTLLETLKKHANEERARVSQRFFKTGPGEYGEGDSFLGLSVPQQRTIAKTYVHLSLKEIKSLLASKIHEVRFTALEILVIKYEKASEEEKKAIYNFYLNNTTSINNWDLVDTSAPYIVGAYLHHKDRKPLKILARSKHLWERRIAIVSTLTLIQSKDLSTTFEIAELLMGDTHDLIHKAVGWMLREAGKRDESALKQFLSKHYRQMPRTMLRYAIERFPPAVRKKYLEGTI